MSALRTGVLLLAALSTGLTAGVFGLYAHTVMPGLRRTDDRTFVGAFQEVDRAINNPWFVGGGFLGALAFLLAGTATHLGHDTLPWVAAALALYSISFVVTIVVNVPLNEAIKAAGPPNTIADLTSVREAFAEGRWHQWNLVRAWTSTVAFGLLLIALVVNGARP